MLRKKLLLIGLGFILLIVGCESVFYTIEPEDVYGCTDSNAVNCLSYDYQYPLEIGNRWEYEMTYLNFEPTGESAGDMTGKIIVTIIDTVTLLDSINAYKFEHISYVIEPNYSQNDTDYLYGNNNENGFVIYGESGGATNGFPRKEIGFEGFIYNTIFNPYIDFLNITNTDSTCNNSIEYFSPEWNRILYPINSDEEWIWFDENTDYIRTCEDSDSIYVINQSNPPFSTVRSYGDTTTYTFDDQVYESFTINTDWIDRYYNMAEDFEVSAYEVYSNIGLMYQELNLGEQIYMDELGNPSDKGASIIRVKLINFQSLTADELIEPENDCDLHWSMCYYCESHPSCPQLIDYANDHWNFSRWVHDYYKWYEYKDDNDDWNAIRQVFTNYSDTMSNCDEDISLPHCYIHIWDYSHKIKFTYKGNTVSSSSDEFKQIFQVLCDNSNIWDTKCSNDVLDMKDSNGDTIFVIKDHHFYDEIAKYNMFTAGWDDTDSIYVITNEHSENKAMTPHKLYYRELMH